MVDKVTQYRTSDGKLFDTAREAGEHEEDLRLGIRVESYLVSRFLQDKTKSAMTKGERRSWTRVRNDILDFLRWEDDQTSSAPGPAEEQWERAQEECATEDSFTQ